VKDFPIESWLPITRDEMLRRGWQEVDVVIVSGDAYVDHPAFGTAVIARVIEAAGYNVAIVPQPNWQDDLRDFRKFGKPRLCFAVAAGNMDSMVNHYTANKRLRSDDAYTPGGKSGFRPDYATEVYTRALKKLYPEVPVIIGGIEASMRRFVHYDYWSDKLKPSILVDSGADLLLYGMAEKAIVEVLQHLDRNPDVRWITDISQTAFVVDPASVRAVTGEAPVIELPSFEQCLQDKKAFAFGFRDIENESNKVEPKLLVQRTGDKVVVVNPPYPMLTTRELDSIYDLPFTRLPHPKYNKRGAIPAFEMICHSVNIHRGCFGGCTFCTLAAHQGKFIASRSEESILKEVEAITRMPGFKGHVSDLGAPSANMYRMKGTDQEMCNKCVRPSCLFPNTCKNLNIDHHPLTQLYKNAAAVKGVKKVTIGSGIRYDMLVGHTAGEDKKFGLTDYTRNLVRHHVSGRLKVAPEHTSDAVLKIMRKPSFKLFREFSRTFDRINGEEGFRQQLVPYFISSHPGSCLGDMARLAIETKEMGFHLEQVQDFTPTPMTLASVIYWSGIHPFTGEPVYTARTQQEKLDQKQFFFWYKPENRTTIRKALAKIGENALADQLLGKPDWKDRRE
jgi:uncharacterized radical SAM protein YgiQ